jgi:hypothetical protein
MAAIRSLDAASRSISLLGRQSARGGGGSSRGSGTRSPGTNTATSPMLAGRLLMALASSGLELKHPIHRYTLQNVQLYYLPEMTRWTGHLK